MAGQVNCSRCELVSDGKLPGDVIVIILCNLPVKSLLKFKAVSKPWYSLISSPLFIKTHLHCQPITANNLILSRDEFTFGLFNPSHNQNDTSDNDVLVLESPPILTSRRKWIIDSCNGLVCLYSFVPSVPRVFILWNPATRKYKTIPLPEEGDFHFSFDTYGLCYVESTNDFKIVGWSNYHSSINRPCLFVYSLSSDSWEKFNYDVETSLVLGDPTFISGCMHWLLRTHSFRYLIAAFDVTDETMSNYVVPDNCWGYGNNSNHYLVFRGSSRIPNHTLVIRGCLSIVIVLDDDLEEMEFGFEVWIMEEYGVEGSWIKLFTIHGFEQIMFPLASWNDGEIVFIDGNEVSKILTFCDPFSKKKYALDLKSFKAKRIQNYVESLENVGMAQNLQPAS